MTVFEFLIIALAIYVIYRIIRYTLCRLRLFFSVIRLGGISGATVYDIDPKAFFLPLVTRRPAAYVKVRDKVYSLRIFNGKGYAHAVHIASAKFAAVFMKTGGVARAKRIREGFGGVVEGSRVYHARTVILPDMEEVGVTPLLVFAPEPRELTCVTKKRTSIRIAFVGDTVFGIRVFTRKTLYSFIDRDSRGFYD